MRVFVTGGTGLVGRALIPQLLAREDEVLCVTRDPARARQVLSPSVECIGADPCLPGVWQERLQTCDAVVNLAGEPVADGRWSRRKKQRIRRSRLAVTDGVARAVAAASRPLTLISGSAVGFYGDRGSEALGEDQEPGQDFLARLAVEWEHTAAKARREEVRIVLLRTGIVMSPTGGALQRMVVPFQCGAGGALGSGQQYFPWIHIQDMVRVILFALDNAAIDGPVNAVVPNPPPQKQFAAALGRALGKPSWLPVPAPLLRLMLGEKADMLLASQRALPNVLKTHGFRFTWGDLEQALADLLPD